MSILHYFEAYIFIVIDPVISMGLDSTLSSIRILSFRDLNKTYISFHSYPSAVLQLKKRMLLCVIRHAKAYYHQAQQYKLVNILGT